MIFVKDSTPIHRVPVVVRRVFFLVVNDDDSDHSRCGTLGVHTSWHDLESSRVESSPALLAFTVH